MQSNTHWLKRKKSDCRRPLLLAILYQLQRLPNRGRVQNSAVAPPVLAQASCTYPEQCRAGTLHWAVPGDQEPTVSLEALLSQLKCSSGSSFSSKGIWSFAQPQPQIPISTYLWAEERLIKFVVFLLFCLARADEPPRKTICSLEGPLDLALELHFISIAFASTSELERANLDMTAEENESRLGSTNDLFTSRLPHSWESWVMGFD